MKNTVLLITVLFCVLNACSDSQQKQQTNLLKGLTIPRENNPEWKELFSNKYTIIPLETTPECLVGEINKIKKFKEDYYVSSAGKSIFHFNKEGKFIASLNKMGQGPEGYTRIEDFDVYEINGRTEIWVADNENLKIYDAYDCSFLYKISYPFAIYRFRRMENSHILLVTGQNKYSLTLTDKNGNVLSEYLKKEVPYLMFRSVQFIKYDSKYLYQLGISNAYIVFDPKTETFSKGFFTKEKTYLTDKQLLKLYDIQGTNFIQEANKGTYICNIVPLNETIWAEIRHDNKNYITKIGNSNTISTEFSYGTFASSISVGDSDNSLLLYLTPDQLLDNEKQLFNKDGNKIQCKIDDNPIIIEFLE